MQHPSTQVPVGSPPALAPERRAASPQHPVQRYGLLFGAIIGLFALLQVGVSVVAAFENHGAIASLYYGLNGIGFNPDALVGWLGPVLAAAYGSCLLAFLGGMWLCWAAGRAAAFESGRRSAGTLAGLLASAMGSLIWVVGSVIAVALVHTDGTISGILTTQPDFSASSTGGELVGLLTQEAVAAVLTLGLGALAGLIGGGAGLVALRSLGVPPITPMPPMLPGPMPPGTPYSLPAVYPPPPESYRQAVSSSGSVSAVPPSPAYLPYHPADAVYPGSPPVAPQSAPPHTPEVRAAWAGTGQPAALRDDDLPAGPAGALMPAPDADRPIES